MKYYIVKAYASKSEIDEGKAFAEAAGYAVDMSGDSPNFTIDTDSGTIFMNGPVGTRLYSLDAFKKVIDDNPVLVDMVEDFNLLPFDDDLEVNGARTYIEDGSLSIATTSTDVQVEKTVEGSLLIIIE